MKNFFFNSLVSTNYKDIGTLYFFFGAFSGIIGTLFSVIMRMELVIAGDPTLNGNFQFLMFFTTVISVIFFTLWFVNLYKNEHFTNEIHFLTAIGCLFLLYFVVKFQYHSYNSKYFLFYYAIKAWLLILPGSLFVIIFYSGFSYKFQVLYFFLCSIICLLIENSVPAYLVVLNILLGFICLLTRYYVVLPEYKLSLSFSLAFFLMVWVTSILNTIILGVFSFVLASIFSKRGKATILDEIALLVKPGLPTILEVLSQGFIKSAKILFSNLEERPRLTKILFVISTAGVSYVHLKFFDASVVNAQYLHDLFQIYNLDSLIHAERTSYIFYKNHELPDFVTLSLEELKKLESAKFEITKRTTDFNYSGPIEGARAIFRQNAIGIIDIVKTRSYSESTFKLLENIDED
jgi:hypothetical protein